jgi:uncharacterized membrane protein
MTPPSKAHSPPGADDVEGSQGREAGSRRYLSREPWLITLAILLGLAILAFGWFRHATYRSRGFDMAYFDQAIWLMAHGHTPFVTVIGRNIFLDHFSPVLVVFVPFYVIHATPIWLVAAQAVALAFGLLALGPLLDEFHLSPGWRRGLITAYVASPLLWNAALFDFHASTLATPFLIIGLTASKRDHVKTMAACALAVLLIRDDLGLAVMGMVLMYFSISSRRGARLLLFALAFVWVVVAGRYSQSIDSPAQWQAHYGYLGADAHEALVHLLQSVARLASTAWSAGNGSSLLIWLMALGLLPLLSPVRLLLSTLWLIPLLVSARFSTGVLPTFHHGAVILPFLLLTAAGGIGRLRQGYFRVVGPWLLAIFVLASLWALNPFGVWIFRTPGLSPSVGREALEEIAASDRVTATTTLLPHLSQRVVALPFPYPFLTGDDPAPLDASVTVVGPEAVAKIDAVAMYVSVDSNGVAIRKAFLRSPYLRDFRLVFNQDHVMIFRRIG